MKKFIICLANSYKYGGRCVGGISVEFSQNKDSFIVKRNNNGTPIWIRPISSEEHGEISSENVDNVEILDVLEIDVINHCPNNSHSENYKYSSIRKISRINKTTSNLNNLCDTYHNKIFYNKGKAVPSDIFNDGNYSLMLIKPNEAILYRDYTNDERGKLRIKFTYNNIAYDLPITDPEFLRKKESIKNTEEEMNNCYLTISLGEELDNWHYKLIAGVIEI